MKNALTTLIRIIPFIVLAFYHAPSCIAGENPAGRTLSVFVSIPPQQYFVEKIGGAHVRVSSMVSPGANPHTYEPKPKQMSALSKATVYFAAGVPFETVWLKKFASVNPKMHIIHTDAGIEKISMESHHHDGENPSLSRRQGKEDHDEILHGKDGKQEMDPHTWLAPPLAKIHIRNILHGLIEADPLKKADFEINYQSLLKEIEEVDAELRDLFSGSGKNAKFMVFHPAWGYFAKAYGLTQISVEMEGKEPKPGDLKRLIRHAKEERIKVIFVQRQFSAKSAEVIAHNIGGTISVTDPMAFEWSENLRETAKKFREALR